MRYIVIQVPHGDDAKDVAFVVMPFSGDYEFLYRVINSAANDERLLIERCDRHPGHGEFPADIVAKTRSSKVVIAVCSPAGAPSPNVMYELGLAHGLGKATILLTDDPDRLPANLRGKNALKHPPQEASPPAEKAFLSELRDHMRRCVNRVTNGLTDTTSFPDIVVREDPLEPPRHPHLSATAARLPLADLLTILHFAKEVHHNFHGPMAEDLAEFREAVGGIYSRLGLPHPPDREEKHRGEKQRAWKAWRRYAKQYSLFRQVILKPFGEGQARVESAFRSLPKAGWGQPLFDKGWWFFQEITRVLDDFSEHHDRVAVGRDEDRFLQSLEAPDIVERLVFQAGDLAGTMTHLVTMADTLIVNLIEAIPEPYSARAPT